MPREITKRLTTKSRASQYRFAGNIQSHSLLATVVGIKQWSGFGTGSTAALGSCPPSSRVPSGMSPTKRGRKMRLQEPLRQRGGSGASASG
jgi:hypothetical protein